LEAGGKILLAAGAKEVIVPYGEPLSARNEGELAAVNARGLPDYEMAITAVHPMGTLRMGDDPKRAVVKSSGEHHGVGGLFVCDGSLFPTALGAPPQISIYGFARHLAPRVLEALKGG